mgnify:CR=1 FL=1
MREHLQKRGIILTAIGTLLLLLGILTGTTQTTTNTENIYNDSHTYPTLDSHEYTTTTNLQPGAYELQYTFKSTEPINQFYIIILDPDGYEIKSTYGPPTTYHPPMTLTFQTQKTGQHTLKLGGIWTTTEINLNKLTQTTRIVYPYEITIYIGITLFATGVPLSLIGASIKEKHKPQWYD